MEKIKKFIPEPFWRIELGITGVQAGDKLALKWTRGKLFD